MHRIVFLFITLLSIVYAALAFAEAHVYTAWDTAEALQKDYEIKLARADRVNDFARALVERMALDSARDPALVVLLKKQGLAVTPSPAGSDEPPPVEAPASINAPVTGAP